MGRGYFRDKRDSGDAGPAISHSVSREVHERRVRALTAAVRNSEHRRHQVEDRLAREVQRREVAESQLALISTLLDVLHVPHREFIVDRVREAFYAKPSATPTED